MSTTTIRLSEELKARLSAAARRAKKSPHAYILEAIQEKAEQDERRSDYLAEAEERYQRIVATGKTVPWREVRAYLQSRLEGKPSRPPRPRTAR